MTLYLYVAVFNIDIAFVVMSQQQTIMFYIWTLIYYISMLVEYKGQDNYAGFVLFWTTVFICFVGLPLFDLIDNFDIRMICNKLLLPVCLGNLLIIRILIKYIII